MFRYCSFLQVIMTEWMLAIHSAVACAHTHFGSTRLWQQYGTTMQLYLSAYQVCQARDMACPVSISRGDLLKALSRATHVCCVVHCSS